MQRRANVNGKVRKYMFFIRDHAGTGDIRTVHNGQWNVTHMQGRSRPNTFVRRCMKNWETHWRSLPALEKLDKLNHALKDSDGMVPTKAQFQARPQVGEIPGRRR